MKAAWQAEHKADGIMMLPDGNGEFTKALGLEMDGKGYGLGMRGQRFALYAENGTVKSLEIEKAGELQTYPAPEACSARPAA